MFALVVGQFDAFVPFLVVVHPAAGQFHHNVGRGKAGVVGQVGTDAERAADASLAELLDVERLGKVERIAEDDGFGCRVYAEFLVAGNELFGKFEFVARIAADAVEQLGLLAAEVAQESIGRIGVREGGTQVAVVDVYPVFQCHIVGMLVAKLSTVEHKPFVGMSSHRLHVIFHGEITVGCSRAIQGVLFEVADDRIVYFEREAAACTKLGEGKMAAVGQRYLVHQSGNYLVQIGNMSHDPVSYLGHQRQKWNFVECHLIHIVRHFHVEMAFLVQPDIYLFGLEAERREPFPVDTGQESAGVCHVLQFVTGQGNPSHLVDGFFQFGQEMVGTDSLVAVGERECARCIRKQFDVSV